MKKILYFLIIIATMLSCTKEKPIGESPATNNDSIGTTSYFRITTSSYGDYGYSKIEPSRYAGKINVVIKSVRDSNNVLTIYNMPQESGGTFTFKNNFSGDPSQLKLSMEGIINHTGCSSSGGKLTKTSAFTFTFEVTSIFTNTIVGWGEY